METTESTGALNLNTEPAENPAILTSEIIPSQRFGQGIKKWACMVPLKTSGDKKPMFLVHGAGLRVLLFKTLSEHFDSDRPVYGIQALGLNYEMELPSSIEGIAKKYLEEMMLVDPIGPYYITGYSMGGIFAYEMTKQLQKMGKDVRFTGLIDTSTRCDENLNETRAILKKIKRQFFKIPFFVKSLIANPKDTIFHQVKVAKRRIKAAGIFKSRRTRLGFSKYENSVYQHYQKAFRRYSLQAANVEVTLFRAEKRKYYLDDNQYLGWRSYALRGVVKYSITGDHKTILHPDHSKVLARKIESAIAANLYEN